MLTLRTANILRDLNERDAIDALELALTDVSVAALQEVGRRQNLVHAVARRLGLKVYQPAGWRGDQAVVWDPAKVEQITAGDVIAHRIRRRRTFVWSAFRDLATGVTFAVVSGHWVAHVEARGLPRNASGPRAVLYRLANRAYLKLVADLARRFGLVFTGADTNVNQVLDDGDVAWFTEAVLERAGQVSNWDLPNAPEGGTHGPRPIDVWGVPKRLVRVARQRVLRSGPSDHDVVEIKVDLTPKEPPVADQRTITNRVVANARRRGVKVLTRGQWDAQHEDVYAYRRKHKPARQPAGTVVQHITVTLDHGPLTGDFKADVRTVERIGQERFGSGISYNWVVDMATGMVAVGQPLDAKGTHTVNDKGVAGYSYDQNYAARAIAVLGMPGNQLSAKAETAITQLLAAMVDEGAITADFDYDPHSKFAYKDCPCDPTRNRMRAIRRAVAAITQKENR